MFDFSPWSPAPRLIGKVLILSLSGRLEPTLIQSIAPSITPEISNS
jgi:hypothetical protein